jgi:hypothetical protein
MGQVRAKDDNPCVGTVGPIRPVKETDRPVMGSCQPGPARDGRQVGQL